ncbi:MAG: hypothetical protein RLZZ135_575 [Cyanobacteriota bacterium]|jgi:hypothetical protein
MTEHIDKQVESAIAYYLRFAVKDRLVIDPQLQVAAIAQFNLNDRQVAEFRLKIYQLNMQAQYTDSD